LIVIGTFLGAEVYLADGEIPLPGTVTHTIEKVRFAAAVIANDQLKHRATIGQIGAKVVAIQGVEQGFITDIVITDAFGVGRT
jgi:hypothetical protein